MTSEFGNWSRVSLSRVLDRIRDSSARPSVASGVSYVAVDALRTGWPTTRLRIPTAELD